MDSRITGLLTEKTFKKQLKVYLDSGMEGVMAHTKKESFPAIIAETDENDCTASLLDDDDRVRVFRAIYTDREWIKANVLPRLHRQCATSKSGLAGGVKERWMHSIRVTLDYGAWVLLAFDKVNLDQWLGIALGQSPLPSRTVRCPLLRPGMLHTTAFRFTTLLGTPTSMR
ncbi:hypothetical protein PRZ48_010170 [Zasmidium cellare]|uniref:Uncharacterized protein n=1 Tax=Zasmidium cellare TaxID=395010 RepID=A0ABR0EDT5_ZASCE|nr:hypothetical protein PRZ48_010170 [Zasmidium cellare]